MREFNNYRSSNGDFSVPAMGYGGPTMEKFAADMIAPAPIEPVPPVIGGPRQVITDTSLSLQVVNVTSSVDQIKSKTEEMGGNMVRQDISRPEFGETGSISIRIPTDRLNEMRDFLRGIAVKVVNESISGTDVTDQYTDYQERIARLRETNETLEALLSRATNVEEIMNIQQRIFDNQTQIDFFMGQIQYIENAADTTLINIYLATDEMGLPYTPPDTWNPQTTFKHAVRSLIGTVQDLGKALIWLGVYSLLIVPALTIVFIIYTIRTRKRDITKL